MSYSYQKHVVKYCKKAYERLGKNLFWPMKNSGEVFYTIKARDFNATSLSTYVILLFTVLCLINYLKINLSIILE